MNTTLGYELIPFDNKQPLRYETLIIHLRRIPTEDHFDPEEVELSLIIPETQLPERTTIHHPWSQHHFYRISAGKIYIRDRYTKTETALCFGGQLKFDTTAEATTCSISSPAPILHVSSGNDGIRTLAEEVEILLAERRAHWIHNLVTYAQKLTAVDARILYFVCLEHILAEFTEPKVRSHYPNPEMVREIQEQRHHFQQSDEWPQELPAIHDLL